MNQISSKERKAEYQRQWRLKNKGKQSEANLRVHLRNKYNLELETFKEMHARQDGKCLICGVVPNERLCVDHCHKTGEVRGLLCRQCNGGLGNFKDNPESLQKAILYLQGEL